MDLMKIFQRESQFPHKRLLIQNWTFDYWGLTFSWERGSESEWIVDGRTRFWNTTLKLDRPLPCILKSPLRNISSRDENWKRSQFWDPRQKQCRFQRSCSRLAKLLLRGLSKGWLTRYLQDVGKADRFCPVEHKQMVNCDHYTLTRSRIREGWIWPACPQKVNKIHMTQKMKRTICEG